METLIGICLIRFIQEDFQTMSYGFKLAGDITEMRASGELSRVLSSFTLNNVGHVSNCFMK